MDKGNGKRQLYQKSRACNMSESSSDNHAMPKRSPNPRFQLPVCPDPPETHPLFCISLPARFPDPRTRLSLRRPTPQLVPPNCLTLPPAALLYRTDTRGFWQVRTWAPSLSTVTAVGQGETRCYRLEILLLIFDWRRLSTKPVCSPWESLANRNLYTPHAYGPPRSWPGPEGGGMPRRPFSSDAFPPN